MPITGTMDASSIDDIDQVLLYGFQEGTRSFAEDGTVTATDLQGRKLTRAFSNEGKTCTSILTDDAGEELGRMVKTYEEDFSQVTITDRHGNVTVHKITVTASGTSTEVVDAE